MSGKQKKIGLKFYVSYTIINNKYIIYQCKVRNIFLKKKKCANKNIF